MNVPNARTTPPPAGRTAPPPPARPTERQKHEAALLRQRRRMRRRDLEFLPAALEILETPPSPIRLAWMASIGLLALSAVVWCFVGRLDVVAVAQGKIQAIGRTKVVQPVTTGRIKTLNVVNGQSVKAGDVLMELDASVSEADETALSANLAAYEAEAKRRRVALLAAEGDLASVPRIVWDDGVPPDIATREQRVLESDIGHLAATVASLAGTVREKSAERDRLVATVTAEERLIAVLTERVSMRSILLEKLSGSKSSVMDSQETLETQQTYLANLKGQVSQTVAAIEVVRLDIQKAYRTFRLENAQKLADAERQAEDLRAKLMKARLVTGQARLRSPIDGIVQGLTVTASGQVVQTGEQIAEVVPSTGGVEIESYLPNQDIGFVRAGQMAIVKVEAFPFSRYGMVDATVLRVAEDAIPETDARQREENPAKAGASSTFGGAQRTQNLVFPMTLALDRSQMEIDGKTVRLRPGMAVTVEVKTGSRRIIDYMLSPLTEVSSGAMRER